MTRVVARALLVSQLALGIASCGGGGGGAGSAAVAGTVVDVEATDGFAFAPAHLTVPIGTTVRWTNKGAVPHTVTSGASSRPADRPGALLDRTLPAGAVVELTFTTAGDWSYFCRYHEGMGMVGLVTVVPDQLDGVAMATGAPRKGSGRGTELLGQRWERQGMRTEEAVAPVQQRR
jgi:plastocyanin